MEYITGSFYIETIIDTIINSDQTIYIPAWSEGDNHINLGNILKCSFDITDDDWDQAVCDFDELRKSVFDLGRYYSKVSPEQFGKEPILSASDDKSDKEMMTLWETYFKDFDSQSCDLNKLAKDCERRIGEGLVAYEQVIRVQRLCRLIAMDSSYNDVCKEEALLIQAYLLHTYGKSVEEIPFCSACPGNSRIPELKCLLKEDLENIYDYNISGKFFLLYRPQVGYLRFINSLFGDLVLAYQAIRPASFEKTAAAVDEVISSLPPEERDFLIDYFGLKDGIRILSNKLCHDFGIPDGYIGEYINYILYKIITPDNLKKIRSAIAF